jgi:hypothetical protein
MNTNIFIQKSFWLLGKALPKCFGCTYCRAQNEMPLNVKYETLPTEVNTCFKDVPVAINLWYGDPTLQVDYTWHILNKLNEVRHAGPICIITKGNATVFSGVYKKFPYLDLHFLFSTFGVDNSQFCVSKTSQLISNLAWAITEGVKYSIEFRPIIYGINDNLETLKRVVTIAAAHKCPIGYSGLQGTPNLVNIWGTNHIPFKPYPGQAFGYKKQLSGEVENNIRRLAKEYNVPIFPKTACLISYIHGYKKDYNAHYYRPNEVGCKHCVMNTQCEMYHKCPDTDTSMIPYPHIIAHKTNHICHHAAHNLCNSVTPDCSNISGTMLQTDIELTSADIRVTKWLTGMTVDCKFVESPHLSDFWNK